MDIPPDCLFTVRFGGGTWHQFASRGDHGRHPVFFALSCHTNELGGELPAGIRQSVLSGDAGIATLTELLPQVISDLLLREPIRHEQVPTTRLSLDTAPGTFRNALHGVTRCFAGLFLGSLSALRKARGFVAVGSRPLVVEEVGQDSQGSMLHEQLSQHNHQDNFRLTMRGEGYSQLSARQLLAELLEGFLARPPPVVS